MVNWLLMPWILITGLVLFGLPFLTMVIAAATMFVQMLRDDRDAKAVLNIGFGLMAFGLLFIAGHFAGAIIS